jgi:Na+/melibiose symporter-like transporter
MNTVPATPAPDRAAADAATTQAIEARKYVKRLRDFYQLLATAVIVIAISMIVNFASGGRLWFYWVIFGFAIAIAFSALDTFGRNLWLGRDWQERKVREYLDRQRH